MLYGHTKDPSSSSEVKKRHAASPTTPKHHENDIKTSPSTKHRETIRTSISTKRHTTPSATRRPHKMTDHETTITRTQIHATTKHHTPTHHETSKGSKTTKGITPAQVCEMQPCPHFETPSTMGATTKHQTAETTDNEHGDPVTTTTSPRTSTRTISASTSTSTSNSEKGPAVTALQASHHWKSSTIAIAVVVVIVTIVVTAVTAWLCFRRPDRRNKVITWFQQCPCGSVRRKQAHPNTSRDIGYQLPSQSQPPATSGRYETYWNGRDFITNIQATKGVPYEHNKPGTLPLTALSPSASEKRIRERGEIDHWMLTGIPNGPVGTR